MGILNVTPDSFYDGGATTGLDAAVKKGEEMLSAGAAIIDVGGMSSRPGAKSVTVDEELARVIPVIERLHQAFPEAVISIDTIHSAVAAEAIGAGAAIINDVSAGSIDARIITTAAKLQVPYVLMHMQGTPQNMQQNPQYDDVVTQVMDFFVEKTRQLYALGLKDVILDPGFGFGKTVDHNYQLLKATQQFTILNQPLLIGLSRKSMICKVLKKNPEAALNGTTALHSIALLKGASILRVHDVKEAVEVVKLVQAYHAA